MRGRDREEEDMTLDFSKQKYLKFSISGLGLDPHLILVAYHIEGDCSKQP
jgi:hypothetical protein